MMYCLGRYLLWTMLATAVLGCGYYVEGCIEEERLALLAIKSYMLSIDDSAEPFQLTFHHDNSSETNNCCHWPGVRCNHSTGRVTELLYYGEVPRKDWLFNVTLIRPFRQLISLGLSFTTLSGFVEHDGICKLKNLVELRLDDNHLHGVLPNCIANMSSLQILDISNNNFSGKLPNFIFSSFKSLQSLNISYNFFEGKFFMTSLDKLSNLSDLRLSKNMLEVQFGGSSWRPKFQLQNLGLGSCNLNITSEAFFEFWSHQTNLRELDLCYNNLHMDFPAWLFGSKSKIRALQLGNNSITGNLSFPHHPTNTILPLKFLDISNNHLHGQLPQSIGHVFPHLQYLNLSGNHFEGPIPNSIALIKGLNYLDLSFNNFSGKLPARLFSDCKFIQILQLSDNNLEGDIIPEDMTLPKLEWLKLSNNRFGGTIKKSLLKSPRLIYLDMSNNNIIGHLPQWIGNFSYLLSLSISQNNLQGEIPKEIICKLDFLDLSHNYLSGSIPTCSNSCGHFQLHLHSNNLSGVIPNTLSRCSWLQTLDLRDNHLSGGIPSWIHKLSKLTVLMLSRNHLHGPIPPQLCQISGINILDLSYNNLSGEIPSCIANLSFGMKIANNLVFIMGINMDMQFPMNFHSKPEELEFLNKNHLLDYRGRILAMMSVLDLSSNKLTGDIPLQLGKLAQLYTLNLSRNFLSGSIPSHFSNLKQVESLDLSFNHLSGQIPSQLVELHSLEIFNVSYNNLSGSVPKTEQFASFDETNYYGNPRLHGYNPVKALPLATPPKEDEDEDGGDHWGIIDMKDFLWSFSMSWVTMFFATILILYINPQWRGTVFDFVDSRILCWFTNFRLNI